MRLLLWNVEWATPRSVRGRAIQRIIADLQPDMICMTEGVAKLLPAHGHVIEADADYGYADTGQRRKVLLWSARPWESVDRTGDGDLPGGRFVAGTTAGVRFIAVCIPWRDAHVRTGRRDRQPWEDHLDYLTGLRRVVAAAPDPSVVLGDFNQRVPRRQQPREVYDALTNALGATFDVVSRGVTDDDGHDLIDHVAVSPGLRGCVTGTLARHAPNGLRLSYHAAVLAEITRRPTETAVLQ